jgi:tetratricopeptide (TPR) repeat protein
VLAGLTRSGVAWAFTSFGYANNWHPLTWISHMLDIELFGPSPGAQHLVSLGIHTAAAAALALALALATGRVFAAGIVAALFALHPLHVESVAWVSERKDVLSGLFFSLGLLAYVRYARRPTLRRWLAVSALYACGLLSKPSLVTVPALLLLLDYWPLGRLPLRAGASWPGLRPLLLEKAPWLAVAAAVSAVTYLVQQATGAGQILRELPPGMRLANAAVAYSWYLMKAAWPSGLSFFYAHPGGHPPLLVGASLALLAGVSWFAFSGRRARPHLLVGWCWYLGMLVPMIGLVQIGGQSWADRYTYLPLTGLFVLAVWGVLPLAGARGWRATAAAAAAVALLVAFGAATSRQVLVWRDGESLFRAGLAADPRNTTALVGLGGHYLRQGRDEEALALMREALRLDPAQVEAHLGIGVYYARRGLVAEEAAAYERGLEAAPESPRLLYNLALAYRDLGRPGDLLAVTRRLQAVTDRYRSRWYSRGFR